MARQPSARTGVVQKIAFDGNVAASNPISAEIFQVCLTADAACNYAIGDGSQTASTSTPFLPANIIKYVSVTPGQSIAAIKAATDGSVTATAGTLWIEELS